MDRHADPQHCEAMNSQQAHHDTLRALLQADDERIRVLRYVADLHLPDCWVGAGFVRSLVWDHCHNLRPSRLNADVDVIWFGPENATEDADRLFEAQLRHRAPALLWSVKNQGRMHKTNRDTPYLSTADAMTHWPETATAVGVRLGKDGIEILAPFGLADLFELVIRPTPAFTGKRQAVVVDRLEKKRWLERWPKLKLQLVVN